MPQIIYVSPYDEVDVPQHRIRAKRGQAVEVPAEVAGREAGDWSRLAEGEGAPTGWPARPAVDEQGAPVLGEHGAQLVETRDPGEGLLAQDCWVPAAPEPGHAARAGRAGRIEGAVGAGQEG